MRNPELTRKIILDNASVLFNKQGYKATSLSDICNAANLTKGAIYKNFKDKAELEKAALQHMCKRMLEELGDQISVAKDSEEKLKVILKYFESYHTSPPFAGGCPLMNASIEADDNNPVLKIIVKNVMDTMHKQLIHIIQNGIKHKQIKKDTDVKGLASVIISSLEGSVMMMKVMDSDEHLRSASRFLNAEIKRILI